MGEYSTRLYIILAVVAFIIVAVVLGLLIGFGLHRPQATTVSDGTTGVTGDTPVVELVVVDGKVVHQPVDDFQQYLSSASGPVFVDFWATWCGPCTSAAPFVEALAIEFSGKAHVLKVDVDRADELVQKYKASSIPLFMVFKNGQIKNSMVGYASSIEDEIHNMLQEQVAP
jgi:thioredoxin 1